MKRFQIRELPTDRSTVSLTIILLFSSLLLISPLFLASQAQSQSQAVTITVKNGQLSSMSVSQLFSGESYVLTVNVLDSNGKPMPNIHVSLINSGGIVEIEGGPATTNSNGSAVLSVFFTNEGLVKLLVAGASAATLTISDNTFPATTYVVPAILILILMGLFIYSAYVGPIKWYREK